MKAPPNGSLSSEDACLHENVASLDGSNCLYQLPRVCVCLGWSGSELLEVSLTHSSQSIALDIVVVLVASSAEF